MLEKFISEKTETNCYLIEHENHVIIIDPALSEEVIDEIEEHGWTADYIILTHEHFDHIDSLEKLREHFHVPVIACQICSDNIQNANRNLSSIADMVAYFKTGIIPEERSDSFTCNAADITFEEEYELEWQNHRFAFRRLPGHSPGSVLINMSGPDGDAIFTGDYLIKGEEDITRLKGGSQEDYDTVAMPALEAIPEGTLLYPGHGESYIKGA